MKFEEYIKRYDGQFTSLMDDESLDEQLEYHGSVWTTWIISFDSIKSKGEIGETAANLLVLWSCLDNKNLRQELFSGAKYGNDILPSWIINIANNESLIFSHAIRLLRRYAMVEEFEELGSYSIHPVVHKWIYHYRYDEIREEMGRTATILLSEIPRPISISKNLDKMNRLITHIKARLQSISEEEEMQLHDSNARDWAYAIAKEYLRCMYEISE